MKIVLFFALLSTTASVLGRPQVFQEEYFDPNPQYNFEYKVASEITQTYITQNEIRDGDFVTGSYTYVDPNGSLITVNYEAGPDGYTENREVKDGFVTITVE